MFRGNREEYFDIVYHFDKSNIIIVIMYMDTIICLDA
jgi:hypothetical protein